MDNISFDTGENAPDTTIIWLHGLGADGQDMMTIAKSLQLDISIRHIAPHAPVRPVTINNNYPMRAWYDITGAKLTDREDQNGIIASEQVIQQLIRAEEARGIKSEHIYLAGFSQGGAMSLFTGLRYNKPLGGIISLSAYLPLPALIGRLANPTLPVFMGAGIYDTVVLPAWTKASKSALESAGIKNITFNEYPVAHAVSLQEISDISAWLAAGISGEERA